MTERPRGFYASPEEHEWAVARARNQRTANRTLECACCGAYFRTTDWPPAICRECRQPNTRKETTDNAD